MPSSVANAKSKINNRTIWPQPHASPWPAWKGSETVPITDFKGSAYPRVTLNAEPDPKLLMQGMSAPWNTPTSGVLDSGETISYAIRLTMAEKGPRTRNKALLPNANPDSDPSTNANWK